MHRAIPLYLPIPLECPGGPAENRLKGLSGFINALSLFLDPDL